MIKLTRFNKPINQKREADIVTNEGSPAYSYKDPRNELISAVATTFLDDKFYESGKDRMDRVHSLIDQCLEKGQYQFLWNLFLVTRQEWHLRSVTHLMAGYLLDKKTHREKYPDNTSDILNAGWNRPDDMAETLAYWTQLNGGLNKAQGGKQGMPYLLREAIEKRFNRMSMFHAAKYPMRERQYSLRNMLRIVRPTAKDDEHNEIFKKIVADDLPSTEMNWRSKVDYLISSEGKTQKEAFTSVIDQMGLFAIVNNLNTFARHGVDPELAIKRLSDREAVKRSKLLPFRFTTAIRMVETSQYKKALLQALEYSFDNLVLPKGNYLIAVDTSGSMGYLSTDQSALGNRYGSSGSTSPLETAAIFGSILARKAELDNSNKVHLLAFGTTIEKIDTFDKGTYAIVDSLTEYDRRRRVGYSTNGYLVYDYAKRSDTPEFDYIMFMTDMQFAYLGLQDPPSKAVTVFANLQGYGSTLVPFDHKRRVIETTSISEKIFDYLEVVKDPQGMIKMIENYGNKENKKTL